jgi:hypothetical protein
MNYDSSDNVSMETKALIFRSGQQDEFGRIHPLAVFGRTRNGYSVTVSRNVRPFLTSVRAVLRSAEMSGMTHLSVGPDLCG